MTWSNLRRKLASGFLFALVAVNGFAGSPVVSHDRNDLAAGSNCTYYSEASKTNIVGRYGKDCCNNTVAWGQKTKWSTCGGCFPCTPPPR